MSRIVAIVNQKGGVGKTTTAVNLGAALARQGKRVLLIDLDPQANATLCLGFRLGEDEKGVYEVLSGHVATKDAIRVTTVQGLSLIPATLSLAGAAVELVNVEHREWRLANALKDAHGQYDFIFIDSPPSLGLLTVNALTAADEVLVPVQAEYLALEGLDQLLATVHLVRENLKPNLNILGALLTLYDERTKVSRQIAGELKDRFPHRVFSSFIPRTVKLAEAPRLGMTIFSIDPESHGARAYEALAREVLGDGDGVSLGNDELRIANSPRVQEPVAIHESIDSNTPTHNS